MVLRAMVSPRPPETALITRSNYLRDLDPAGARLLDCPPELLEKIFEFADDGGGTARALSLVSRYISAVSFRSRYRSVTLVGWTRIEKFSELVYAKPTGSIRVYNLFIADHSFGEKRDDWSRRRMQRSYHGITQMPHKLLLMDQVWSILTAVAPTLQTLVLSLDCPADFQFLPRAMPMLSDLTLLLTEHDPFFFGRVIYPVPSLRRLHIGILAPSVLIEHISTFAPNLTHLMLSGIGDIESFLRERLEPNIIERSWASLPLTMTSVALQPGVESLVHNALAGVIRCSQVIERAGFTYSLALLKHPDRRWRDSRRQGYNQSHAFIDWVDLINDGEGAWAPVHVDYSSPIGY